MFTICARPTAFIIISWSGRCWGHQSERQTSWSLHAPTVGVHAPGRLVRQLSDRPRTSRLHGKGCKMLVTFAVLGNLSPPPNVILHFLYFYVHSVQFYCLTL